MSVVVESGATLSLYNANIGVNYNAGWNRCKLTVKNGGALEIHGNFWPRCADFEIEAGGSWLYGADVTLQNCNKNYLWYLNNRGTATFENGLCKFSGTWSAPWKICQLAGEMVWGGPFKVENNLYYQIELTGGKVSATGDVSFTYDSVRDNYFKFTDGADLDIEVADGKTLDLTPFTYDGTATIRKTGAGVLKLADVPTAISMKGGAVTFVANSQTAMTSLEIGEGQSFTVASKNTTIDKLVALDGSLTLAAAGLTVKEYAADSVAGTISVTKATYATGDVIITTPSAELRAAVKAAAQAVEMNVDEDGETLTVGESNYVFNSTTVTDLLDATGWKNGSVPPENSDVVISGAGVTVIGTASSLAHFGSISLTDGADLRVSGETALPTISVGSQSSLTVLEGASATLGNFYVSLKDGLDPLTTLPKVTVAAGAILKVQGGTAFKNCAFDLKGTMETTSDGTLTFGTAVAGETTYMSLVADGATITAKSEENGVRLAIASPLAGGRVVAVNPITIKDSTITYVEVPYTQDSGTGGSQKDGFSFGVNNPSDQAVKIVVDNTRLNFGAETCVAGGVNLVLTNGSVLCRARNREGDYDESLYNLRIQNRAVVTLVSGGEIRTGVTRVNNNVNDGAVYVTPDETGFVGIEILDGGIGAWYKLNGQLNGLNKGAIRVANGFFDCWKGRWWGWSNRNHLFNNLTAVEIVEGTTMTFRGVPEKMESNSHLLEFFELEAPFTGGGDLFFTNTWAGTTMEPTIYRADNTCTGTLLVAPDSDTAKVRVHFANGANWAGTVVFNGNVDMLPIDSNHASETNSAMTATFGRVKLTSALPLRVWREEDGSITSDTITLKSGFVIEEGDAGVVELVAQDGFELAADETIALGTFPTGAFANVTVKCGRKKLSVVETATATEGVVTCKAKRTSGFKMIIR